jgi:hypothetical protein
MKRLNDQVSAQKEHKQLCEQALRIERDLRDLTNRVAQIQRFYRDQYYEADNYQEQSRVRSAENELIRLTRKISSLQTVLNHLSAVRFTEVSIKSGSNQSSNKIDKNVRASTLVLKPEGEAESGFENG